MLAGTAVADVVVAIAVAVELVGIVGVAVDAVVINSYIAGVKLSVIGVPLASGSASVPSPTKTCLRMF